MRSRRGRHARSWTRLARVAIAIALGVALVPAGVRARSHRHHRAAEQGVAASFDYSLLSLSWSPEHCSEQSSDPDDPQCGTTRHYGFVVHGLWPQRDDGGYPRDCPVRGGLTTEVVASVRDIMPSDRLIAHEWSMHGACSGLSAPEYFERARRAFTSVVVPARYRRPDDAFRVTADDVRRDFAGANPALPPTSVVVLCHGHFFSEMRLCLSKDDLTPRACGRGVSDACRGQVTVRPIK